MKLTDRGQEALDAYLAEVERCLAGRADVDAFEVLAGIREHVEAELAGGAPDPATAEDVASVLERLGPPTTLAAEDGEADGAGRRDVSHPAFVIVVVGAALGMSLLLVPSRFFPVGWLLLAGSLVAARLALPAGGGARSGQGRAVLLIWRLGVLGAAAAVLLGPAALVWAAAQIGGVLRGPLASWAGPPAGGSAAYWVAMTTVAAGVTGLWWMLCGWLAKTFRQRLRSALDAAWLPSTDRSVRGLSVAGVLLLALSLVGVLVT